MHKIIIIAIFFLLNSTLSHALNHANETKEINNKNSEIQDINTILINNDYKKFILNKKKYNYTIITIWAKWCGICKKQLKIFNDNYAEIKQNNIEIIALSLDKDNDLEKLKDFAKNYDFPMALYSDTITNIQQPRSIPTTYFLDKNYKIFKIISGKIDKDDLFEILKIDNNDK